MRGRPIFRADEPIRELVYRYHVHSLRVRSELALPDLGSTTGDVVDDDVVIRLGSVECPVVWCQRSGPVSGLGDDAYVITHPASVMVIRGGCEVVVDVAAGADMSVVRALLLGPALGVIHAQRRRLVLHGAAVRRADGTAVVFVGPSRIGKSTLAMGLGLRGWTVLADDMSVITLEGVDQRPHVLAGLPRVKLWPEAAQRLGLDEWQVLPRVMALLEKRLAPLPGGASQRLPAPLAAICVLEEGDELSLDALTWVDAVMRLVGNTYRMCAWPREALPEHMALCASLVERVPVMRLARPRDLAQFDALTGFVEQELLRGAVPSRQAA